MKCEIGYSHWHMPAGRVNFVWQFVICMTTEREVKTMQINRLLFLLRNAMTGSVVRKLPITSKPYSDNHEKELVAFIKGLQ